MSISYEWVRRGYWYQTRSKLLLACECYKQALEADPQNQDACQLLGAALVQRKKFMDALPILERTAGLLPGFAPVWFNYGLAKSGAGDFRGSIKDFSRAFRLDKSLHVCWRNIANSLLHLKRYWSAVRIYHKYQQLCPKDLEVWPNIIKCYLELGMKNEAFESALQAIEYGLDTLNLWEHIADLHKKFSPYEQVKAIYSYILCMWPEAYDSALSLSCEALANGDFKTGWDLYEARSLAERPQGT